MLSNAPFHLVVGCPLLKHLGGVLDFKFEEVQLDYREQQSILPMVSEHEQPREVAGNTDSEDFTSNTDMDAFDNKGVTGDKDREEELVLAICDDRSQNEDVREVLYGTARKNRIRAEMNAKLNHLCERDVKKITNIFVGGDIVTCLLQELKLAYVPVQHSFQLSDERPTYHRGRKMPPQHKQGIRRELDMMLKAGIFMPPSPAWSFPVVMATRKNGNPNSA